MGGVMKIIQFWGLFYHLESVSNLKEWIALNGELDPCNHNPLTTGNTCINQH